MYTEGKLHKKPTPTWLQVIKLGALWLMRKCMTAIITMSTFLYTIYVALVTLLTMFPIYIFVCFASESTAAKACQLWARFLLFAACCPLKVSGRENVKQSSPVIFAANHASYIDAVVCMASLPPGTMFVAKKEIFETPILRTFARKLRYLSIDRLDLSKGLEDTKSIMGALRSAHSVLIFPEGTFGYATGLRPFRLGAFKVAVETQTPVCPVALKGTRYILRNSEKMMRPGRIEVTMTKPIYPSGLEWQDVTQLRNAVREEIKKYCGEPSLDFIAARIVASAKTGE